MNSVLLSICIPTYNRAKYLEEAINSIFEQIDENNKDKIEICISDNASTDNTDLVIEKLKIKNITKIIYNKNIENLGPDKNYFKSIEIANGKYCWFLGSDDKLKKDSINRILQEINSGLDIYLCNRIYCDINMNIIKNQYWLNSEINDEIFNFSNKKELINYLSNCISLGGLFSYLSSIIFKRNSWNSIQYDNSFDNTAYSHVSIFFAMILNGCNLKYIKEQLILCRGGNDSFIDNSNFVRRIFIDINGYTLLANKIFKNNENIIKLIHQVLKIEIKKNYFPNLLAFIKVKISSNNNDWKLLIDEYNDFCNIKKFKHKILDYLFDSYILKILYMKLKKIYVKLKK